MLKNISIISVLSLLSLNANILENNSNTNLSMGYSSSNIVKNSNSLLNNPAASATELSNFDTSMSIYGMSLDNGLLKDINSLNDIDINDFTNKAQVLNTLSAKDLEGFYKTMEDINTLSTSNNNMIQTVGFSTSVSFKNISVGFNTNYYYNLFINNSPGSEIIIEDNGNYLKYDKDNNIYVLSTKEEFKTNSFNNSIENKSTLNNLQIIKSEIPISYSDKFRLSNNDVFKYSGSFKIINLKSSLNSMLLSEVEGNSNAIFDRNDMNTNDIGVGLNFGLIYNPRILKEVEIGLTGTNINKPVFKTELEDFKLDSQYNISLSYNIDKNWILTTSGDLKENEIFNYKSQNFGLGVSFIPSKYFNLRTGLSKNIVKDANASTIYTAGFSFGFENVKLDISGAYSNEMSDINDTTLPSYMNLQSSLVIDF